MLLLGLLLAGCGGATLTDVHPDAAPAGPAPARLVVATTPTSDTAATMRTAQDMTAAVVAALQEHGIAAEAAAPDQAAPDAVRLVLDLLRVEEGDRLTRIAIGFGLGQSRLEVRARLLPAEDRPEWVAFQAMTHSGYRPGLVLPLGVGIGMRTVFAVAGAAGTGVAELRGRGPTQDMREVADAIAERTARYLRQDGWQRPPLPAPIPVGESALAGPVGVSPRRG